MHLGVSRFNSGLATKPGHSSGSDGWCLTPFSLPTDGNSVELPRLPRNGERDRVWDTNSKGVERGSVGNQDVRRNESVGRGRSCRVPRLAGVTLSGKARRTRYIIRGFASAMERGRARTLEGGYQHLRTIEDWRKTVARKSVKLDVAGSNPASSAMPAIRPKLNVQRST